MKIGLLIIATEILDGKTLDLNTHFFSEYLRKNQLELRVALTVRDKKDEMEDALDYLFERCQVVVTSGGLGPTKDDLTKQILADYFDKKIVHSAQAQAIAQANYDRLKRDYPGKDHCYSTLPEGFVPLNNSAGFAPGFYFEEPKCFVLCAPGVPKEFQSMVKDFFPKLVFSKLTGRDHLEVIQARTKRVPEEKIFGEVDPTLWDKLEAHGVVSSLPTTLGVDIAVKIKASTAQDLTTKKERVLSIIQNSPVAPHIWHLGHESLEEVIVNKATEKKITYGFVESATGGFCAHRITNVSGSSEYFYGSLVTYHSSVKENVVSVKPQTLEKFSAVSSRTAEEMAQGAAEELKVDIAVSITGYAGPSGGTIDDPVGTCYIGTWVRGEISSEKHKFTGDREQLKLRFSQMVLLTLLAELEKIS